VFRFLSGFSFCMLSQVQTLDPILAPLLADMVHNETSAEAEQRLRGVLSSISQRDLVILHQLLPGQIRLATSSLVQGSAADNLRTFTYHSSVLSTAANHSVEDRVDCERRLREALSSLPKRELHFLRQLVPQFHIQQPREEEQSSAEPSRYPRPAAQPARCRSRSRSPTLVDRSFASSCGVQCSFPGCQKRCGKVIFALGPPSHLRHYCQDHR
jgi:hypothetical protein